MTRTAFVSFRDEGFWVYDVAGAVFLWHLIQEAEHRQVSEPWLEASIAGWRTAAVITELPRYADDKWKDSQVDVVVDLSRQAIDAILSHGDFAATEIESWPIRVNDENRHVFPRGRELIPAIPVANLGEAFVQLLLGNLPKPPHQTKWFFTLELEPATIGHLTQEDRDSREKHVKELLSQLTVGETREVVVSSILDFGVRVDLEPGGISGWIKLDELSSSPVEHPSVVVQVGDKITARVLEIGKGSHVPTQFSTKALDSGDSP